jgi:kynurenine 3-monooxygenase
MVAEHRPVTIVGAGLAGSVLAAQLGQRGVEVDVYERRPDPRITGAERGRSINLALSTRGLAAITQLGLREDVLARALPMRGRTVHPVHGDTAYQPYSAEGTRAINSISRSELNAILLSCAEKSSGVRIHFAHRVTEVDPEKGVLTLATPEGTRTVTAEVILANDGAYSAVRASLQFREGFTYSQDFLDHGYKELTIAAGPDGQHQLDPGSLHIWPRGDSMMIALPNLDGSYTCTLFWPKTGPGGLDSLRTPAEITAFFEQNYPDAVPLMPTLVEDYQLNPSSSLVTVRCRPWVSGRVALVGDAAHAIVPFYGQGANAAMEDCVELVRCFDEARGDWSVALPRYQDQRKPNTDAIADFALANFVEMRDSVGSRLFRAKTALRHALERGSGGRYTSRYELVSFSTVPYADIAPRLRRQNRLLAGVAAGVGATLLPVLFRRRRGRGPRDA